MKRRQASSTATLALGYAGGAPALITAGHLPKDTPEEELLDIRDRWRKANPAIVQFWSSVEAAAKQTVQSGRTVDIMNGRIRFAREFSAEMGLDFMTIQLPSGRKLYYPCPRMTTNRFGSPSICYLGIGQKNKKWEPQETYGGKLTENITQAVARDCLAEALERLEAAMTQAGELTGDQWVGFDKRVDNEWGAAARWKATSSVSRRHGPQICRATRTDGSEAITARIRR